MRDLGDFVIHPPYFIDVKTTTQERKVTWLRSQSEMVAYVFGEN